MMQPITVYYDDADEPLLELLCLADDDNIYLCIAPMSLDNDVARPVRITFKEGRQT